MLSTSATFTTAFRTNYYFWYFLYFFSYGEARGRMERA